MKAGKKRIASAARRDPEQVAKIIKVQEAQIAEQAAKIAAAEAVIIGVAELYVYDYIDEYTGEIIKGYPRYEIESRI